MRSLCRQVGPEVAVLDARRAIGGFDARRSALARRYRYLLLRTPWPDPLLRSSTWHVPGELDIAAMRLGADTLLGEHDFAAFCRRPPNEASTVRCVRETRLSVEDDGRLLAFEIEANAFCHQMVRSIVGALVAVGKGRMTAADLLRRLRARDRLGGQSLAPPFGLCLEHVRYPRSPRGRYLGASELGLGCLRRSHRLLLSLRLVRDEVAQHFQPRPLEGSRNLTSHRQLATASGND